MNIYFPREAVEVGGADLLVQHLGKAMIENGDSVYMICARIDPIMKQSLESDGISVIISKDFDKAYQCVNAPAYIVTFEPINFARFYAKCGEYVKTVLYDVLDVSISQPLNDIKRELSNDDYNAACKSLSYGIKEGRVLFMDEYTVAYTQKILGEKYGLKKEDYSILRIPVADDYVPSITMDLVDKRLKHPHILAISRADFPFKGYLLGLIDWFKHCDRGDIELDIISYGQDYNKILMAVEDIPIDKQKRLHLYGKTKYEDLRAYLKSTCVFVGMGTTILDASINGVITIAIEAWTYELKPVGFFTDDYHCMVKSGQSFDNMIDSVLAFSSEEYKSKAIEGQRLALEHYGMHSQANKLIAYIDRLDYDGVDQSMCRLVKCMLNEESVEKKRLTTKLKKIVDIAGENVRYAVYPYGYYGRIIKKLLNDELYIKDVIAIDNGEPAQRYGAIPISNVNDNNGNLVIILSAIRDDIFDELLQSAQEVVPRDRIFSVNK